MRNAGIENLGVTVALRPGGVDAHRFHAGKAGTGMPVPMELNRHKICFHPGILGRYLSNILACLVRKAIVRIFVILTGTSFFYILPENYFFHGPGLCLFKRFAGWECWGCGMTRAFYCILHLQVMQAISYNRFVLLTFPLSVWLLYKWAMNHRLGNVCGSMKTANGTD